jgi:hypothetical protein
MVGLFRQKMWQDPYARAWLVLKPSKKIGVGFGAWGDQWDFRGVDRIFAAFINPQATYAKPGSGAEFKKLLYNNKSQGSDSGNIFSRTVSAVDNFWDRIILQHGGCSSRANINVPVKHVADGIWIV